MGTLLADVPVVGRDVPVASAARPGALAGARASNSALGSRREMPAALLKACALQVVLGVVIFQMVNVINIEGSASCTE